MRFKASFLEKHVTGSCLPVFCPILACTIKKRIHGAPFHPGTPQVASTMEKELQQLKELHRFYLYHDYKTGEIAREMGVSRRTVQRWLSGKSRPSEKKLNQLGKLLNKKRRKT